MNSIPRSKQNLALSRHLCILSLNIQFVCFLLILSNFVIIPLSATFHYLDLLTQPWEHHVDIEDGMCSMLRYDVPLMHSPEQNHSIHSLQMGLSCVAATEIHTSVFESILKIVNSYHRVDENGVSSSPYAEELVMFKFQVQARVSFYDYAKYAKLVYYFYALENNISIIEDHKTELQEELSMQRIILSALLLNFNFGDAVKFVLPCNSNKWIYEEGEAGNGDNNFIEGSSDDRNIKDVDQIKNPVFKTFRSKRSNPYLKVRSHDNSFIYFESIFAFGVPQDSQFPHDISIPFQVHLKWHDKVLSKYFDPAYISKLDESIRTSVELTELQQMVTTFAIAIDSLELAHVIPPRKIDLESRNFHHNSNLLTNHRIIIDDEDDFRHPCRLLGTSTAILLNHVVISHILQSNAMDQDLNDERFHSLEFLPRIFCGIFTTKEKHDTNIAFIRQSWGRKCTGFLVFSTIEDLSIPAVVVDHMGEEAYSNMWQKSVAIWKYIDRFYREDYDWFMLGGDDMYVIMENLYEYLDSDEIRSTQRLKPGMYLGLSFTNPSNVTYNSGGPGYLLDRKALEVLIQSWKQNECNIFKKESAEDMMLGLCLRDNSIQQILPFNTSDRFNRHRFHLFEPGFLYTYIPLSDPLPEGYWQKYYDLELRGKVGVDCCSTNSISFHDITYHELKEIEDYLFHCSNFAKQEFYDLHGFRFYNETRELASWGKRAGIAFNVTYNNTIERTIILT